MPKHVPLAIASVLLLAPSSALAGAGGASTLACDATQQVLFVIDTNGNGIRDPGENSPCTNPVVDATDPENPIINNGAGGPVCLPAVLAQMRGTLALIADDDARDNNIPNFNPPQRLGEAVTILIELREQGQIIRIADSYAVADPVSLGALNLGNWDARLSSESKIFAVKFLGALRFTPSNISGNPVSEGAFDDIADKLSQVAEDLGLVPDANAVEPIVADAARDGVRKRLIQSEPTQCGDAVENVPPGCGELEVQEDGPLASIAVYRVTFSFAEKLTGAPPGCS